MMSAKSRCLPPLSTNSLDLAEIQDRESMRAELVAQRVISLLESGDDPKRIARLATGN
jgi:hypothetical protein